MKPLRPKNLSSNQTKTPQHAGLLTTYSIVGPLPGRYALSFWTFRAAKRVGLASLSIMSPVIW